MRSSNARASAPFAGRPEARIKHLREKAEAGQLVTFNWSTAKLGERILRMNGQHSSKMLCDLNGAFPKGLKVHLDTYEVDSSEDLAILFVSLMIANRDARRVTCPARIRAF